MNLTTRSLFLVVATLVLAAAPLRAAEGDGPAPPPQTVSLTTKDGVLLKATYYPSTAGKNAAPVVLLPDLKATRTTFGALARRLQSPAEGDTHPSFAVIAVDLRGHGDSLIQKLPNGDTRELNAARLNRDDMLAMVSLDMEAVRKFLVTENDAGRLNLNKLSLVGIGLGASVAVSWAAVDWAAPPLAVVKQGQDVKALVLVSPQWNAHGLGLNGPVRQPGLRQNVAVLMLYGEEDSNAVRDVDRIYRQLDRYHPVPAGQEADKLHSLSRVGDATTLQGASLLAKVGTEWEQLIVDFLVKQVAEQKFEWINRRQD